MTGLLEYAERMTRRLIGELPDGEYRFRDCMDSDGIEPEPVEIAVTVTISGDEAVVDFSGSAPQVRGSINTVYAVTVSATYYVFRALIGLDVPTNSGWPGPHKSDCPGRNGGKCATARGCSRGECGNLAADCRHAAGGAGASLSTEGSGRFAGHDE